MECMICLESYNDTTNKVNSIAFIKIQIQIELNLIFNSHIFYTNVDTLTALNVSIV